MRFAPIACALLVAAACARTPRVNVDPETGNVDVDVQRTGTAEAWTGSLRPVGTLPVMGVIAAHVSDDLTHATVALTGGVAGATYPWHVHEGRCGDNGPIVGAASAYPALRPGADGRAAAEAHLSGLELNEAKQYYVNVHASPTSLGTIVACGALDD